MQDTVLAGKNVSETRARIIRQAVKLYEAVETENPLREGTLLLLLILSFSFLFPLPLHAEDSNMSRKTLTGIQAVSVEVEELQPNIQKYAAKFALTKTNLQGDVVKALTNTGISVVSGNEWLNTPGRPVLYVNVNTHETEKYWYAYDIKIELRQIVYLETNPKVRILSDTWSISITGIANIGTLNVIRHDVGVLVDRFVEAYWMVNQKK
jgi:hypothetical protein